MFHRIKKKTLKLESYRDFLGQ